MDRMLRLNYRRSSGNRREILYSVFGKCSLDAPIVDVGCGTLAKQFAHDFQDYIGIDISASYNSSTFAGMNIVFHDFTDGSLPKIGNVNTILCLDVLEHIENPAELFSSMAKMGGRKIIISLPNNWLGLMPQLKNGLATYKGYGLNFRGFPPGKRHHYFFNTEEAIKFIFDAAQDTNINVSRVYIDYRRGNDGPIYWLPVIGRLLQRAIYPSKTAYKRRFGSFLGEVFFSFSRTIDFFITCLHYVISIMSLIPVGSIRHSNKYASGVYFELVCPIEKQSATEKNINS